jgi:hypothetical protein
MRAPIAQPPAKRAEVVLVTEVLFDEAEFKLKYLKEGVQS